MIIISKTLLLNEKTCYDSRDKRSERDYLQLNIQNYIACLLIACLINYNRISERSRNWRNWANWARTKSLIGGRTSCCSTRRPWPSPRHQYRRKNTWRMRNTWRWSRGIPGRRRGMLAGAPGKKTRWTSVVVLLEPRSPGNHTWSGARNSASSWW